MNIALLSPSRDAYSETFILEHKKLLRGNIFFYYGDVFFLYLETQGYLVSNSIVKRGIDKLWAKYFLKLDLFEYYLYKSFKRKKINLVFAEYGPSGVKVLNICKRLNLPLIVHFHGFDAYMEDVLEANKERYREMFGYASKIISVSKHMQSQLIKLGCPERKSIVNPCGPHSQFLDVNANLKFPIFIAIGRFVDKKAPYYLILSFKKVIEKHPEAKLVIGGDGPLYEACINIVKALKLENNITLPGRQSRGQFLKMLENANGFIQHSITASSGDREGTPVAVLEAMAAALPVVSTKHTGIAEVIINGETGWLVDEHDVDLMADCIITLLEKKDLAKEMGLKGRELIRKKYTIEHHIEKLNMVISQSIVN
jgi:colanic acid/amylovoran biosynthesis glycosyltransferase